MQVKIHFPAVKRVPDHDYRLSVHAGGSVLLLVKFNVNDDESLQISHAAGSDFKIVGGEIVGEVPSGSRVTATLELLNRFESVSSTVDTSIDVGDEEVTLAFDTQTSNIVVPQPPEPPTVEDVQDESLSADESDSETDANAGGDSEEDKKIEDEKTVGTSLEGFKLTRHELKILREHNVTTLEEATTYYTANGGFEPMKGLSDQTSRVVAVKLGLVKE